MSKNTRRRASDAAATFGRMDAPAKQPETPPTSTGPATSTVRTTAAEAPAVSKYTILLSDEDAMLWDQLAMTLRRDRGGRKVDKSAMLRALVYLAAEDDDLRRQVVTVLEREGVTA